MLRVEALAPVSGTAAFTFDVADGRCMGLLARDAETLRALAECACGVQVPVAGRVLVGDLDVARDRDRARSHIAAGFARAAHHLTSLGEHAAAVAGSRRTRLKAADAIARLGLDARTRLNTPSAKSAAAVIAALLPEASVVILHDPFRDLDARTRERSIDWIRSLSESGAAVLVTGTEERDVRAVSHDVIDIGDRP